MELPKKGSLCWFEICTTNEAKAKKFFTKVLAWGYQEMGEDYWAVTVENDGIGGLNVVKKSKFKANQSGFIPYFIVPSVKKAAPMITKAGGKLVGKNVAINDGKNGHYQLFKDLDGNTLGLWSKNP